MSKKKFINLFLSIALTTTFINPILTVKAETSARTVDIEDGLIGYWNFDDETLKNLKNNDKNGMLVGSNISIKDSEMGKALYFSNSSDSYMKVPEFINTGEKPYSMSMWYKYDTNVSTNKNTVLLQQDNNGGSILLLRANDKYGTYVHKTDVDSNGNVNRGSWQHITITMDPTSKKIKYYVNGELDSEKLTNGIPVNELTSLLVGRHKNSGTDPQSMKGEIDELRVYEKIVTDEEARAIYNYKSPIKTLDTGLIGYWNFDDGQAKNLAGSNDGRLVGNNVSIKNSSDKNLGKSLVFTKGNDSNLKIENFLNTAENSYSFSLWYKAQDISRTQHTVLLQQDGNGKSLLTLRYNDNKYGSYVYEKDVLSAGVIAKENWQNIIITINKDSNKIKYYINGKLDGEYDAGSNKVNELTSLLIGSHKNLTNSNPQQFVGEIDEIRVYDYVIGDTIAKEIYDDITIDHNITLTINADNVQREIDRGLFGINHRYAFNGYGSFDPESGKVREDFELLYKEANFGSIRYPGGTISNLFRWKDSIGDKDNRKNQIHGFYSAAQGIEPNFGLDEIGTFATDNNSEIIYVYGLGRGSASDAADLIEYLNAEVGTNPNGGIAWAEVRKENGHPEPYNIRYFEIGNEMNQGGGDGSTSQMYWTQAPGGDSLDRYINGGTVAFTKQEVVEPENWNSSTSKSNGEANQVKYMRYANIIPGRGSVTNEEYQKESFTAIEKDSVEIYVNDKKWDIVSNIKKAGQKDAVEVDYFTGEIKFGDGTNGNIPEVNSKITVSYKVKKDGFVQVSKAMRETIDQINKDSNTNKEIHIYSSYESKGFINTMNAQNQNYLYDGLTIHPYSGDPGGSGEYFYNKAMKLSETNAYNKVKEYVDIMPEGKVPVISEFGIFRSTNPLVRSQTHALYIAKSIMDYVNLGSPYIQKHCLVDWYSSGADALGPTQQAVIQAVAQNGASGGEGDYKFFSTPSAHVFELYNGMFGNEIIESSFNNMITFGDNVEMFNALTSKDDYNNIYVAIVNFDIEKSQSIKINVNDMDLTGKKVDVKKLSGDSFSAENSLTNPNNVAIESSFFVSEGEELNVELDPHSFTIFKINSGEISEVNKKELEELYNANKEKVEEDYTEESWKVFEVALNEAKLVLEKESATQEEADSALEKLRVAVSELKEKIEIPEVNKKELEELYNANKEKVEEDYTEGSWKVFEVALNETKLVLEKESATQEEVDSALEKLRVAVSELKEKVEIPEVNKKELEELYNANKEKVEEDYIEGSWKVFEVVLNEAKLVLEKESATQEEVDSALERLRVAVSELKEKVEIPEVNKKELEELYNANKEKVEEDYTEESWKVFEVALNNAKEVLDNKNTSQSMVEEAINKLNIAVKGLKVKDNDTDEEEDIVDVIDKKEEANNELPKTGATLSSNTMLLIAVLLSSAGSIILGRKKF